MKRTILLALFCLVVFIPSALAQSSESSRYVVKVKSATVLEKLGFSLNNIEHLSSLADGELYAISTSDRISPSTIGQQLLAFDSESIVEPDIVYVPHGIRPKDPLTKKQWAIKLLDLKKHWKSGTDTKDVIFAVLDCGVETLHEDLSANVFGSYSVLDGSSYPRPLGLHATRVIGIVGALGNNQVGMTGITWNTKILSVLCGPDTGFEMSRIILGLEYVLAVQRQTGSRMVIIASWGNYVPSQILFDELRKLEARGNILVVCSAGNNSLPRATYPAAYTRSLSNLISVAATTEEDTLADFSNFNGEEVDLGAPGDGILTTNTSSDTGQDDQYQTLSGTSLAGPHVAGIAGLHWTDHPDWTAAQIKQYILASVVPLESLKGKCKSGGRLSATPAKD